MAGGSNEKSETAVPVAEQLAQLSAKFERLEAAVQRLAEERPADQRQLEDVDIAGRRHVDNEQRAVSQSAVAQSYSELQSEFRAIKDSVAKIKLPTDLVVGDTRAGVSRSDVPRFNLIQKSARFQETTLKLLSAADSSSEQVLADITTVALAHVRFLQEEYTNLLVSNQFDEGTSKLFSTLQQNPAAFPPSALENLQRAVSIAGARPSRQVSGFSPAAVRGRGSDPGVWRGGGRGYGFGQTSGYGFGRARRPGFGSQPAADWTRGRPDCSGRRDGGRDGGTE